MRKQYDDFTQLKPKEMSKCISEMTYKYINPETQEPTRVPPTHYEKILDQITEKYMAEITNRQFLTIMYNQLVSLKKEDEKYFNQALVCMDMGINPKDLKLNEQIAIASVNDYIEDKKKEEKKDFHFLSEDITEAFTEYRDNPEYQSRAIKVSNMIEEERDFDVYNRDDYGER